MTDKQCEDCLYFNSTKPGLGFCNRYPPSGPLFVNTNTYPIIQNISTSCGEFKPRNKMTDLEKFRNLFKSCGVEYDYDWSRSIRIKHGGIREIGLYLNFDKNGKYKDREFYAD